MIPSGYKEDVVYSQIPTNGSGDLSFTRASNGTRINSAGLVEVCPWNLAQYSEDFDNAYWSKDTGATVNSNVATAPNGTTTADRLNYAGTGQAVYKVQTFEGTNTFSVYLKGEGANIGKQIHLEIGNGTGSKNVTLTGEWQRFETDANNATSIAIKRLNSGQADAVLAWGIQVNQGALKPYFPTTDRLNVPRLTYQNGGGGCPSLLLEKQSTNLALSSEDFTTTWSIVNVNVSANSTTSPDGTQNADSLIEDTSNNYHYIQQGISTSGTTYTYSIYAKNASGTRKLIIREGVTTGSYGAFDLVNGTVTNSGSATASIESVGNGWYRCIVVFVANSGSSSMQILISDTNGLSSYTGNGTSGFYLYGAQVEASSYPTSYIPTTSASATRVADACFKTGISSLIGQSEGFIAGEVEGLTNSYGAQSTIMSVSDGTTQNRVMFSFNATTGYVTPRIFKAGSTIFVQDYGITLTQKIKFAIGWGGGRAVCYVNGTQVQETTGLTFFSSGTLTRFGSDDGAGSNIGIGKVSEYILGTSNLTNDELISLTTL